VETNAEEILRATRELGFSDARFRCLAAKEAASVYQSALKRFVPKGNPQWWWEHFPSSVSVHRPDDAGWKLLNELVPDPDERVWFIAEDFVAPGYSVWEASVRDSQKVIAECYHFEYSLVQQRLEWLVCENHHSMLIAVGNPVEDRLQSLCPGASRS
jgi:hypothetical protein